MPFTKPIRLYTEELKPELKNKTVRTSETCRNLLYNEGLELKLIRKNLV